MKKIKILSTLLSLSIAVSAINVLPANAAEIVASGQCGDDAYYTLDSEGTFTVTGTGATWSWDFGSAYLYKDDITIDWDDFEPMPWFESRDKIKRVVIGEGISEIGDVTFWDCDNLTSVELASTVTSIIGSFECCDNLFNIRFPEGMKDIGWGSFLFCTSMSSVELPESVSTIGLYAFDGMSSLDRIVISNPECNIYDSIHTINNISYAESDTIPFSGVIIGHADSTAQVYADKYGIDFKALDEFSKGDVNLDNAVNAIDASQILTEYAGISTGEKPSFYRFQNELADVNADSGVDASDASSVLAYYAYTATGDSDSVEDFLNRG